MSGFWLALCVDLQPPHHPLRRAVWVYLHSQQVMTAGRGDLAVPVVLPPPVHHCRPHLRPRTQLLPAGLQCTLPTQGASMSCPVVRGGGVALREVGGCGWEASREASKDRRWVGMLQVRGTVDRPPPALLPAAHGVNMRVMAMHA